MAAVDLFHKPTQYERNRADLVCATCRIKPPRDGMVHCADCAAESKARRDKDANAGLCIHCRKHPTFGKVRCPYCTALHLGRELSRLCHNPHCNNPPLPNKKLCYGCAQERYKKRQQNNYEWKLKNPTRAADSNVRRRERKCRNLYIKQKGRCAGCGLLLPMRLLAIDHIIPKSVGGRDMETNYQLLCQPCNSCKLDRPNEYLRETLLRRGIIDADGNNLEKTYEDDDWE